jgi:hypothetical protein
MTREPDRHREALSSMSGAVSHPEAVKVLFSSVTVR